MSIHFKKGDHEAWFDGEIHAVPSLGDEVQVRGDSDIFSLKNMDGIVARRDWYYSVGNKGPICTITLE